MGKKKEHGIALSTAVTAFTALRCTRVVYSVVVSPRRSFVTTELVL